MNGKDLRPGCSAPSAATVTAVLLTIAITRDGIVAVRSSTEIRFLLDRIPGEPKKMANPLVQPIGLTDEVGFEFDFEAYTGST